jgi:kojibiose phosphorylase
MIAWESAATGDEATPKFVPDPAGAGLTRVWTGERELHISSDIAYAAWQYWRVTGDDRWMLDGGARLLLETARFWESRVAFDAERVGFGLGDVIGPDEYHERVDNNAYTNGMVQWHMDAALRLYAWLRGRDGACAEQLARELISHKNGWITGPTSRSAC